jgi:rRNA maturation RNase YbeY
LKTDKKRIRKITESLLTSLKLQGKDVSILLVDNARIRKLNNEFFRKDRPTNVISFSYIEPDPERASSFHKGDRAGGEMEAPAAGKGEFPCELIGDIVISLEKAHEEASRLNVPFHERVFALLIHGLLHIVGFDHEKGGNGSRRMRYREKKLLAYVTSHRLYKEITL